MLGDSFSSSAHQNIATLNSAVTSLASSAFAGGRMTEASAASSRIETAGCVDLADRLSITTPVAMVGLTEAAAAMMMRSPQGCSLAFEESPISVLQGFGDGDDSPSPSPPAATESSHKLEAGDVVASLDFHLNDASSHNNENGICRPAESDISDGVQSFRLPLLHIRSLRRPPLSEESGISGCNGRRTKQQKCKSSCESINRVEEIGEEEVQGNEDYSARTPEHNEDPESEPTTPCSTIKPLVLECPDAPSISTRRSKDLNRQSSLNDTKLLLTTHLKRSASIFMFDKHFEFLREIGRGSYSTVYEARDRRSGTHCAVKMSKRQFSSHDDRDHYLREIQSVSCLTEHPNVVKYYRSWQQDSHFYIQMELCEGGNLRTLTESYSGLLPETMVWNFTKQVAAGLEHIHSQGVLHLDIKPENIFVDSKGVLKIGDFGLAIRCHEWDWEEGDGGYVAPELLKDEDPTPAADIYSFGVMVYEWTTATRLPRSGPLREGRFELPEGRSKTLGNLVRSLLQLTPSSRPTASEVISWPVDI
ncbi:hypothetical protein R1sor_015440 [Riccia sorocarpa]|uniref:Protein kinase domain-containing protein n=1 Tax=Riccia sorocarpa TaxID=122646 RepID=A0ABD3HE21_9MARC